MLVDNIDEKKNSLVSYLDTYKTPITTPKIKKLEWEHANNNDVRRLVEHINIHYDHLNMFPDQNIDSVIPANHIPLYKRPSSPSSLSSPQLEKININIEITDIADIIKLIDTYPLASNIEYNIDMQALHRIAKPLKKLNSMIGMNTLKNNVTDQILYYLQGFHKFGQGDFMHTVIYGPPGTGKTEVAKIIGQIYKDLGILKRGKFKKATRADLIAGYLGQTAMKTRDTIQECLGGVLFIDEAYALGNNEKRDSFAKECIDTLCEALSDHKDDLMVIIAGYEEELKTCFFDYNQGLDSRFTWRFNTDDYTPEQLREIFFKKIRDAGWSIENENDINIDFFIQNKENFKYAGRDMETLLAKVKVRHSRRIFGSNSKSRACITKKDIEDGFKLYMSNEEVKRRNTENNSSWTNMYL